ncbi:hypothetical protein HY484_02165 [Candidatus Woesearchaeota archaeon]|nr:hypothetical protein [Candidatus Woesearchaeota archaeon]
MAEPTTSLLIVPPLVFGAVIGLYEILLIHRDVTVPTHRFGHGLHALVFAIIATFCTMNVSFVFGLFPQLKTIPVLSTPLAFQIAIGLITVAKIHGASAAIKGSVPSSVGLKETWAHSILIGALVVAAPYVYPLLKPMLPKWLQ